MTGCTPQTRAPGRPRRRACLVAALLWLACAPAPAPSGPPGAWWVGRAAAVDALLAQLAALEGTPLARSAAQLAAMRPDCPVIGARVEESDFAQLVVDTRCVAPGNPLFEALSRADAEIAFALPGRNGDRPRGSLGFDAEALVVDLRWPGAEAEGALALLLAGEAPAGPDRLASAGRLVHVRMRPRDGIDPGALVPADSQADRLFRLRDGLLADAVLDGTWEAAVYLPERADGMPGVALALGFRVRSAAVAAADRVLADLNETWGVQRSALRMAAGEGACLPGLNVLPDFAPCYLATDDALVLGWNPTSLERALASAPGGESSDAGGRIDVDLALIHRADTLIARQLDTPTLPLRWPWRRLRATGGAEGDTQVWQLRLPLAQRAAR